MLKWTVEKSDDYALQERDQAGPTYSRIAGNIAEMLEEKYLTSDSWDMHVQSQKNMHPAKEMFWGSHQAVPECFLAKIIEMKRGKAARDKFIAALGNQGFANMEGFEFEVFNDNGQKWIEINYTKWNKEPAYETDYRGRQVPIQRDIVFDFSERITVEDLDKLIRERDHLGEKIRQSMKAPVYDEAKIVKELARQEKIKNGEVLKQRVIVMLGSRMANPKGVEDWQFPIFVEKATNTGMGLAKGEVSGGWARMRGIQAEYENFIRADEQLTLFTTGGREPGGPLRSDEAARQLVEVYGLPKDIVTSLNGSGQTIKNAERTAQYIDERPELASVREIEIATNDFHMLRAWLMFSASLYRHSTGRDFTLPDDVKEAVRVFLESGLKKVKKGDTKAIKVTRDLVMDAVKPFLEDSKIKVNPLVSEESLERTGKPAGQRYARMLRENKMVLATVEFEYKGIMDFLEGRYKLL
jgi:hypothetical protein